MLNVVLSYNAKVTPGNVVFDDEYVNVPLDAIVIGVVTVTLVKIVPYNKLSVDG